MCSAAFPDALDDIAPQDNHFRYCASTRIRTRHFYLQNKEVVRYHDPIESWSR